LPERLQAAPADLVEAAFGDDVAALPVLAAVEQHQHLAAVEEPERLTGVALPPRQPQPEHVDRGAQVLDLQAGPCADRRMPAVGADDEIRADLERAFRGGRADADGL